MANPTSNDTATFYLPKKIADAIKGDKPNIIFYGGRVGGKSTGSAVVGITTMLANPYTDCIFARVSYGSLKDSSYAEVKDQLDRLPPVLAEQFVLKKAPLRIERVGGAGVIYFVGYGGSNTSRTKSFHSQHPLSLVVLEETQELRLRENLDQIRASVQRLYTDRAKFVVMGNPPATKAHWFNQFIEECRYDADWEVVNLTWQDIIPLINDFDLKDILKTKLKKPDYYRWFYMGEPSGAFGSVYPMFQRDKHVISAREFGFFIDQTKLRIQAVIIGADGAVNRDETVFLPLLLLGNGQAFVAKPFIHNPQKDAIVGSHKLVQNYVQKWFNDLCKSYGLGTMKEYFSAKNASSRNKFVPIFMRIDNTATDLVQECRFYFGNRCDVGAFHKKTIVEMVGVMQSAMGDDRLFIIDYGGYYDYYLNKWIMTDTNPIADQIEMLIWNERQDNYDRAVPNDRVDALTYGVNFWFGETENIEWLTILRLNRISNVLINDIIKKEEEN